MLKLSKIRSAMIACLAFSLVVAAGVLWRARTAQADWSFYYVKATAEIAEGAWGIDNLVYNSSTGTVSGTIFHYENSKVITSGQNVSTSLQIIDTTTRAISQVSLSVVPSISPDGHTISWAFSNYSPPTGKAFFGAAISGTLVTQSGSIGLQGSMGAYAP
jgi:hypothetical protein